MPPDGLRSQRSLLQRRKSLTTTLQAMIDGLIVLLTVYYALYNAQGFISTLDAVFMITLLAIMGVTYDQMIVWDLFTNYIEAADVLDVDKDYRDKIAALRARLVGPPRRRPSQTPSGGTEPRSCPNKAGSAV